MTIECYFINICNNYKYCMPSKFRYVSFRFVLVNFVTFLSSERLCGLALLHVHRDRVNPDREGVKKNWQFWSQTGREVLAGQWINKFIYYTLYMLTFFYCKLASNLVMLIAGHLLFYGLHNTEKVMNEITHLPDSQNKICLENPTNWQYLE